MTSDTHPARRSRPLAAQLRTVHSWIGMLIAPSVIFFAATGIVQIFSLHEARAGYTPPPLIEKLGKVHKDQEFVLGRKKPRPPGPKGAGPDAPHPPKAGEYQGPSLPTALLKWFFTFVALGLIASTVIGVWIGLQQRLRRRTSLILLSVGLVVPVMLAALTG
jgi:hypothetical protein